MHLVIIGGSDAGISAALRARELDPAVEVTVVVADRYPNYSICGIPYYFSGEVRPWQSLAHRTLAELEATGMRLRLDTLATRIDVAGRRLELRRADGAVESIGYDALVVGTGASPTTAGIAGLDRLGSAEGVHVLHSMADTFALEQQLDARGAERVIIIGAGYVGLEMAEGLRGRGIAVTQLQRGPEVLSTLDSELGALVRAELERHEVDVVTGARVESVSLHDGRLMVAGERAGRPLQRSADLVLAVVGVRPNTELLVAAGAAVGAGGAVVVDEGMRTGLPGVWAAGDGVVTHHRLLGQHYLPLGTTAHKQGRVAGENAIGGDARFGGSLGTQVLKVFDLVAARTGLLHREALAAGVEARTVAAQADDHKAYYPGATPISVRITGDAGDGRLLGAQLVGRYGAEVAKRVDVLAAAIHHGMTVDGLNELDLAYTPPLGAPWDAVQQAAQAWVRAGRPAVTA